MSAYICSRDHIAALAAWAALPDKWQRPRVDPRYVRGLEAHPVTALGEAGGRQQLAQLYAEILYTENVRSVATRYPGPRDELPGPTDDPGYCPVRPIDYRRGLAPVAILKMCDCLEYQSCETDDYRQTLAAELLNEIRRAAIRLLPGYEDAPWGYTAPTKERATQ